MTLEQVASYRIDRTGWEAGPWDAEPDRVDWEYQGFPCMLIRNRYGVWCGYVGLPHGHPLYGVPYQDVDLQVEVHGGLTYSDACQGHICHVPKPGQPDDVWWFGFDCGHAYDLSPGMQATLKRLGHELDQTPLTFREVYRDQAYAQAEVQRLAAQLLTWPSPAA